jgi:hypothetical protein
MAPKYLPIWSMTECFYQEDHVARLQRTLMWQSSGSRFCTHLSTVLFGLLALPCLSKHAVSIGTPLPSDSQTKGTVGLQQIGPLLQKTMHIEEALTPPGEVFQQ